MLYPSSTMLGARFSATVRNPDPCVSHKRDRAPARTRGPAHDMLHATAHRSPRRAVKRRWGRPQHHCAVAQSLWSRAPLSPLHCAQSPITSRPRPSGIGAQGDTRVHGAQSEHPALARKATPGIGAQGDTARANRYPAKRTCPPPALPTLITSRPRQRCFRPVFVFSAYTLCVLLYAHITRSKAALDLIHLRDEVQELLRVVLPSLGDVLARPPLH